MGRSQGSLGRPSLHSVSPWVGAVVQWVLTAGFQVPDLLQALLLTQGTLGRLGRADILEVLGDQEEIDGNTYEQVQCSSFNDLLSKGQSYVWPAGLSLRPSAPGLQKEPKEQTEFSECFNCAALWIWERKQKVGKTPQEPGCCSVGKEELVCVCVSVSQRLGRGV